MILKGEKRNAGTENVPMPQYQIAQPQKYVDWTGIAHSPALWEAGDWLHEQWQGH